VHSASKDHLTKIWDVRMLQEFATLRAPKREVTALSWHPLLETLFVTGHYNGSVHYSLVDQGESQAEICGAHETSVTDVAWHPLGHMLTTVGMDPNVK
jgi:polyadenylation factor subunit 2